MRRMHSFCYCAALWRHLPYSADHVGGRRLCGLFPALANTYEFAGVALGSVSD